MDVHVSPTSNTGEVYTVQACMYVTPRYPTLFYGLYGLYYIQSPTRAGYNTLSNDYKILVYSVGL